MFKVGLTGGIGSGKSTVARVFGVLGIPVFDADEESKRLLREDDGVKSAVIAAFGTAIYPSGELDRAALASIVFKDAEALAKLNAIAHPAVRKQLGRWVDEQRSPYVLVEAALMVDTGWYRSMDQLIVVSAPEAERVKRVLARDGVTEEQVLARIRNQVGEEQRLAVADAVIRNDGTELVIPQVLALHEMLTARAFE
jgi:dephospho-CoA kinase